MLIFSRIQIRVAKIVHRLFYVSLLWKMVNKSSRSVLDVGCGKGSSIIRQLRKKIKNQYLVGCDVFPSSLKMGKQNGLYDDCVLADVRYLPFKARFFELVFCLEVIEHFEKAQGEKLLQSLENLVPKDLFISAPVGFMYQDEREDNPYHVHRSAWFPIDFKKRGYHVVGVSGPFFIGNREMHSNLEKFFFSLAEFVTFFLQPLFYFFPRLAFQMICGKKCKT